MSWQATSVVDSLPYDLVQPLAFRVLLKLANDADANGRNAWGYKGTFANELGVHPRSIQRAFAELQQLHLIRRGDQRCVSHIPANKRPSVFDIVMTDWTEGQQPLDDTIDESEPGETEISTAPVSKPLGETPAETTAVTNRKPGNQSKKRVGAYSTRANVCAKGHRMVTERHCELGCLPLSERALA